MLSEGSGAAGPVCRTVPRFPMVTNRLLKKVTAWRFSIVGVERRVQSTAFGEVSTVPVLPTSTHVSAAIVAARRFTPYPGYIPVENIVHWRTLLETITISSFAVAMKVWLA